MILVCLPYPNVTGCKNGAGKKSDQSDKSLSYGGVTAW